MTQFCRALICVGNTAGTLALIDGVTHREVTQTRLPVPPSPAASSNTVVTIVMFSPVDGGTLVAGTGAGQLHVLDSLTLRPVTAGRILAPFAGNRSPLTRCAFFDEALFAVAVSCTLPFEVLTYCDKLMVPLVYLFSHLSYFWDGNGFISHYFGLVMKLLEGVCVCAIHDLTQTIDF